MPSHISRKQDWELLLVQWLQGAIHTPFQWGQFDCALAAADALSAQTGLNFARGWRGQYSTGQGALKQLLRKGYQDVYEAMTDALQTEAVAPERLQRGDIAGVNLPAGKTLGVVWSGAVWLPKPEGLRACPMSLVECGWKVISRDGEYPTERREHEWEVTCLQ